MKEADMNKSGEKEISRRTFVDLVIKGGLWVALVGALYPALSYLRPVMRRGSISEMEEVGGVDDIPVWGSKKVIIAGSAILVIRTPNEFKAFSAICTHLGCLVDWDGQKRLIICPCHAGVFDLNGQRISGPPPRPLPAYAVSVVNSKIFVKV